ncbi:hypothetical protein KEF29_17395 [Streptomyces tuirus]|uniref:4,5-dihydroxyphthalate decarboxylase n=1 Tax=Streptomyces tuirus TaxID=68278 RepID=A0A941FAL0_9ACTN|nr:hypothetical protein [Streptomyces tuirus]
MSVTIAIEPYDRHLPLLERASTTDSGVELDFRSVGQLADHLHGRDRHERFLHHREFDVAELSLSSYLMYRQDHDDIVALPVFPRRMFGFSNAWVRRESEAESWADLKSGVVGVPTFQMSMGIVARHDMAAVEGIDWTSMTWASSHPENIELDAPVRRLAASSLAEALGSGEIDAMLTPEIPADPDFRRRARRLYGSRSRAIEIGLLRTRGYAPIVHLVAARTSVLERHPDLGRELVDVFTSSQETAWDRYSDPGWGLSFWGALELEEQEDVMGRACWAHGLEPNRRALRDFCGAAVAQGILPTAPDVDRLFWA